MSWDLSWLCGGKGVGRENHAALLGALHLLHEHRAEMRPLVWRRELVDVRRFSEWEPLEPFDIGREAELDGPLSHTERWSRRIWAKAGPICSIRSKPRWAW